MANPGTRTRLSKPSFAVGGLPRKEYAKTVGVKLVADPYILSLASDGSAPYKPSSLTQAYKRVAGKGRYR